MNLLFLQLRSSEYSPAVVAQNLQIIKQLHEDVLRDKRRLKKTVDERESARRKGVTQLLGKHQNDALVTTTRINKHEIPYLIA